MLSLLWHETQGRLYRYEILVLLEFIFKESLVLAIGNKSIGGGRDFKGI